MGLSQNRLLKFLAVRLRGLEQIKDSSEKKLSAIQRKLQEAKARTGKGAREIHQLRAEIKRRRKRATAEEERASKETKRIDFLKSQELTELQKERQKEKALARKTRKFASKDT